MPEDRAPWFVVRADIASNHKLAELPSDSARWGWVAGVLAEAKRQRPSGRFTSRQHYRSAVPAFARFLPGYLAQGLLEVAPALCGRCRRVWRDIPDGWLVVHDWNQHQRDPGAAQRVAGWRANQSERTPNVRETNGADTQDVRGTYDERTPGVTGYSRARGKTETETETLSPAGERAREPDDPVPMELLRLIEDKTGRPWAFGPGNRSLETLRYDVRDFGVDAVRDALNAAPKVHDASVLVNDAHKRLNPMTGSYTNGRHQGEASEDVDREAEATKRYLAERRAARKRGVDFDAEVEA